MKHYIIFGLLANMVDFVLLFILTVSMNWAMLFVFMVLIPIAGYFLLEELFECTLSKGFSEAKNAALLTLCQILIWCAAEAAVYFAGVYILGKIYGGGSGALGMMLIIGAPFASAYIVLMPLIKGIRLLARRKE